MKVALDPGHGGHDPGAVGKAGLEEADTALAIVTFLYDELVLLGHEVVVTRWTDEAVALGLRCSIANDAGADVFVSVHLNSDGPEANGIETLYSSAAGKALAEPIQKALIEATGERDRGLKERDDLYVLNGTVMPAILVEVGFISHPESEQKLAAKDYQLLVAQAIAAGLKEHLA
jgi:N-acetylmuramoyl-L-alanine amidase